MSAGALLVSGCGNLQDAYGVRSPKPAAAMRMSEALEEITARAGQNGSSGSNECYGDVLPIIEFGSVMCFNVAFMKALIAALVLLITGVSTAETKSQCSILVNIDSIMYAGTKDETVDSVTVCEDGKATGFHSFTAPALGDAAPQPTKWDYSHEIDRDSVSDLQKLVRQKDIADLQERIKVAKTGSTLYVLMHFQIVDQGKERNIALQAPMLSCTDEHPEMPKGVLDLVCVFSDLYARVKTGVSPEDRCGCKSLHEMVISP